jgi:trypsin
MKLTIVTLVSACVLLSTPLKANDYNIGRKHSHLRAKRNLLLQNQFVVNEPVKTVEKEVRIVGGISITNSSDYPYVGFPVGPQNCAATLFTDNLLLTTMSCKGAFLDGVFIGGTTIDGSGSRRMNVVEEIVHPDFDSSSLAYDIMILKLDGPVVDIPKVKLNLYKPQEPEEDVRVDLLGYGATNTSFYSSSLQKVRMLVAPDDRCSIYGTQYNPKTMICTWFPQNGRDSCNGDSGGPVMLLDTNIQVGIISFGEKCASHSKPSVNTRISAYSEWIQSVIDSNRIS